MESTGSVRSGVERGFQRDLPDAEATRSLGAELAGLLGSGSATAATLLLDGDLGAGKTCLVQGLAAAFGIEEPVTSPTFALAQHYRGHHGALVHLDLYRLEQPAAADELMAQEEESAREQGAVLAVEWPERLGHRPTDCWWVALTLLDPADPDRGRRAVITPPHPDPAAAAAPR